MHQFKGSASNLSEKNIQNKQFLNLFIYNIQDIPTLQPSLCCLVQQVTVPEVFIQHQDNLGTPRVKKKSRIQGSDLRIPIYLCSDRERLVLCLFKMRTYHWTLRARVPSGQLMLVAQIQCLFICISSLTRQKYHHSSQHRVPNLDHSKAGSQRFILMCSQGDADISSPTAVLWRC